MGVTQLVYPFIHQRAFGMHISVALFELLLSVISIICG